jgi:transposase
MLTKALVPCSSVFKLEDVAVEDSLVKLTIHCLRSSATCPKCDQSSERVHSRYWRTVADLPCSEHRVQLHLMVRRFFCDNCSCARRTFAERFPSIVSSHARRTNRLAAKQRQVGLVLGGEYGARVLRQVGMPISGDTVLRLIRSGCQTALPTPRVLGVDDWAWRKGQQYGTILVDLERHRPVDLLPDRTANSLAAWLKAHPGVEIVSSDRSREYGKGIAEGAPEAIQVADRWHLLQNLKDALVRTLEQNQACLYAAATEPEYNEDAQPKPISPVQPVRSGDRMTKAELRRRATRERRLERYNTVIELHQGGMTIRAIARELGMGRGTVRRYLNAGSFPEMGERKRQPSILDPYLPYLESRWAEGYQNSLQLFREIEKLGYPGSRQTVSRWAWQKRKRDPKPAGSSERPAQSKRMTIRPWSARYAVWLLIRNPESLSTRKKAALERMLGASSVLRLAYEFAQDFLGIVRHRLPEALESWLTAVLRERVPGLYGFARSLEQDKSAVLAALMLSWSNGQVEGQVTRLKLIKRQMYGRAKFDLLRLRVLARASP